VTVHLNSPGLHLVISDCSKAIGAVAAGIAKAAALFLGIFVIVL